MKSALDHIVFAAASLDEGSDWLEQQLGVSLTVGGEHPKMGTHNRLLRIGERSYLEVIAINPDADKPAIPRWFALDDPGMQARLETPKLVNWVAQTDDIRAAALLLSPQASLHSISRGVLNWLITIPDDGAPAEGGMIPTLIEWESGVHPTDKLSASEVTLIELELGAPDPLRVLGALEGIGLDLGLNRVRVVLDETGPRLTVSLNSPKGVVRLS